jgi:hypothetical protein
MQKDGFFFKVLHFQRCKTSEQIHQTLQTKDMYGNAKKGMDNKLPIQKVYVFFQEICSK